MARQEARPVGTVGAGGATVVALWRGVVALDNHNPPRRHAVVTMEEWDWPPRDDGFVGTEFVIMGALDAFPANAVNARWLLDDGETVRAMYSSGYHPAKRYLGLKAFKPSNRADDGPRTVYHMHIQREGV